MFEAAEGRITLKHLLQQAQAGPRGGDGELGVQRNHYKVCHAIPLDLQHINPQVSHEANPSKQSGLDKAVAFDLSVGDASPIDKSLEFIYICQYSAYHDAWS